MKYSKQITFIILLMIYSLISMADKIAIRGEPVFLYKSNYVYFVPDTYTTDTDYNYVTIDGIKKVCYLKPQSFLSALNMKVITVNIKGQENEWICYNYDDTYFTATP